MDTPDPHLIQALAEEFQGHAIGEVRAKELAAEVGRLNGAVLREAGALRFADEPGDFACKLDEAAR
jgi:hypothetical protein